MTGTDVQVRIRAVMDVGDAVSNVGVIQKSLSKLKLPDNLKNSLSKNIGAFYKEYEKYQKRMSDGIKTQGDFNQIERSLNHLKSLYSDIGKEASKAIKIDPDALFNLNEGKFRSITSKIEQTLKKLNNVKINTKAFTDPLNEIEKLTKNQKIVGDGGILTRLTGHIETGNISQAKKEYNSLIQEIQKAAPKFDELGNRINKPGTFGTARYEQLQAILSKLGTAFDKASQDVKPLENELNRLQTELAETINASSKDLIGNVNDYNRQAESVEKVTDSLRRMHEEEYNFNRQAQDIDRQIQTYFGLSQMIRKVGDIARDAFNTVKELDAAMVETAVVTNFSVGDMWEMLPTYTKNANQLGSTIKDVYEAATLYYQQGLNQTQSMGLANETLKMARIGGLEATEATNMMTAALRGFNMELNQTSAQRINDVYSELAAITAADTKEIGSAMERTASIADSANMEFETTSAFLAQMIETTREAPENLGTAMKTIIARFQEMKQDPTKLVDSEGVAMDANRVDTALKTIGVNLTNTKGEFRDLDDVFLEISEKWDSLSQGQQRYIATIAAGARQQSRFIAMMQNYDRVKELVDAANNSAGASQKQFEKTLTSMASKLNRLKNAWDQFTMGLLNNQILKGAVDGLTGIFTVVNKIINALGSIPPSPFEGITKSALTLVSTLGMLQLGKKTARGAIFAGAGWWKGEGTIAENFKNGWGPKREKQNKESIDQEREYWNRVESRLTSNAKERVIKTPIDVDTYLRKIDTSDLDVRVKDQIEQELDKIGNEPITEDVQIKINNIIDQDAQGTESLHITDDMVSGIPKIDQFEGKINKLAGKVGQVGDLFQQLGSSIGGPFGNALSTAGSLLTSLSITLDATATSFMANFTAELQAAIGADANTAATLRMQVAQAGAAGTAKALGVALWSSLGPLAAIAAAIGLAIGAYKLLDAAIVTDKERLESTNDAAAKASEAFDLANQELSELRDSISSVRENEAAFDNLVVGTAEFNEQLVLANQQISDLVNKYPMLMDEGYVTTDKNGLMHISEEGLQAVEDYQKQIQARASAVNIIQSADLAALEKQQKATQLYRDWGDSEEDHKKNIEKADLLKQQAEAETEVAHQNAINTALAGTEVKNVEKLSAIYAGLYDFKRKAAEQDVESLDSHSIRQKYADYHGYTYNQSTKKMKDVEGNEVEYDDSILKDEVIEQTVLLDFEENAGSLEKTLGNLDTTFNDALSDSFKDIKGADTFISDLLSNNIETNEDLLKQVLSNNSTDFQNLVNNLSKEEIAAILDISAESVTQTDYSKVTNLLTEKAKNIVETQSKSYEDLGVMLAKTNGLDTVTAAQAKNQKQIINDINELTSQQAHMMSNIGSQLEKSAGTDTMQNYIGYMRDLYKEINQNQFGNINLDTREKLFNKDGSISTVLGSWGEYGEKSIPIAFSPMLQTGTGNPEKLDQKTIDKYLDQIVTSGKGDKEKILELDAQGIDVDGKHIKGLIADIGKTAEETSTKMHEIEVDKEAASEIEKIFNGADLSSASGRLKAYTDLTKSSLDTTRQLGNNLMNLPESANLLGEAFSDFLGGDFTELEKKADDFKNSMGEFDSAGILEMAKSSQTLQTLLDSGKVSATGLANALQGVTDGSISQVNTTTLELLSSLNRLEDAAAEAHNIIANFDAGTDTGEGEDFVKENAKAVKKYMDNNEWGNEQLETYIKLAAGEERWNEVLKKNQGDLKKTTKELDQYATKFSNGFQAAYDDMIARKGINGKSLEENIDSAFSSGKIDENLRDAFKEVKTYWDDEGFMQWDFGNLTTDQLEQYFQDAYGVGEDYAKLLLQDILNYNETEGAKLAKNDLQAAVGTNEFQEGHQDLKGNIVLSDADLKAFEEAGGDITELNNAVDGTIKTFKVLNKDDERRTDTADLLRDYAETFKTGEHTINSLFKDKSLQNKQGQFDLQKLITDTQTKGFDQDQAIRSAYDAYVAAQKKGEETAYDGVTLDDNIKSLDEFQTAISEITEGKQWRSVGESIAEGILSYLNKNPEDKTDETKDESNDTSKETKKTSKEEEQKPTTGKERRESGEYDTGRPDTTGQPSLTESTGNFFNVLKEGAKGYKEWLDQGKEQVEENKTKSTQTSDTSTPSMGEMTAQAHLQEMMKSQFSSLFASLSPESFNTPEMQNALNSVYRAALTPQTDTLTQGMLSDFETLGINVNDAIQAGLVIDKNGILSKATEAGKEGASATEEGLASGAESTDGSKAKEGGKKGGEKVAQKTEEGAAEGASKGGTKPPTPQPKKIEPQKTEPQKTEQPQETTYVAKADYSEIESAIGKVKELNVAVSAGGTYTINVPGVNKIVKASQAAAKLTKNAGDKNYNVNANVTGTKEVGGFTTAVKAANKLSNHTVKLTAKSSGTAGALSLVSAVNSFKKLSDHTVTLTTKKVTKVIKEDGPSTGGFITTGGVLYRAKGGLTPYPKKGTDRIPAYLTPGEYVQNRKAVQYFGIDFMRKINHKDLRGALQSFGSAATGRYGRLGPRGKGGPTLTGEEGFEIAWLPSESRSLILGANGPQMINLPPDAVVWTNEQSKKILKQEAIPMGSHSGRTRGGKGKGKGKGKSKSGGGSGGSDSGSSSSKQKIKGGTVSSYIFNIEQKIAQVKKKQEALQKRINKQLEKTSVTLQAISGNGNQDLKRLRQLINLNGKLVKEYNKQLRVLDKTGKTTIKWTPKSKKGKKLKEKSKSINLGKYIYQDPDTGAYQVNYGKINKEIGKKDGEKAKAVKEAAEKAISDKTSKRDSAEAAADEAREKIAELGKQLYDTFHGWKNELTKIYDLTKRIEAAEQHTSRLKAAQELQEAKLSDSRNTAASEFIETTLNYFKAELASTADEMAKRNKAIEEQRIEVIRAISSKNELAEVQNATRAYNTSKAGTTARVEAETRLAEARDKLNAIQTAQKYYSVTLSNDGTILNENFNATALAKDVNAGKISEKQYNLIKEYVDNVREQSQTLNDLLEEQSSSIKDLYESLGDLKEQYSDRAKELLESVENADEENLDKLEKLNDALSDALKDLLDEIKRRLEQRRQQEDNLEKEEDISDKQRRLAALRADNSGANAKEIKQLEKEIADLQRDYGRTLEDQALDRLQDQADKAAEQRERQIQILNAQLDYAKNTGGNRLRVEALLADPEGNKAEIKELWRQNNKYYDALSQERDVLDQRFNEFFTDISKDGLPAKIASTTTSIDKANTILSKIQSDINKLIQDLNAPRTSSGQSSGGQNAVQMKREGMNLRAIVNGLRERGVAGKTFQNQIRKAGFGAKSFKSEGFSVSQAKTYGGFSTKELRAGGYSAKEVKGTVKSVNELIRAGYGAKDLKAAGYKAKFLKSKGFNAKQLRTAGFTAKDLKAAGFTAPQLKAAGYSAKQVIGAGYSTATLLKTGYTGAQIQSVNKTSTAAIQNAITKNIKNRNVTQSDLAGTKATIDVNGKKQGGKKAATVAKSGTRAVIRSGSTLYTQALDGKGRTTGKANKISVGSFSEKTVQMYPSQARAALLYAIQHQKPGTLINKRMKTLISKVGLNGKKYKLQNKVTGSISGGKIYYNSGKKGVYIWDPSKKNSLKLDKYNKNSFKSKAKHEEYGSEYREVLKKNGVKGYATGGLADYTGPAWLDGTPSKPELVLDAQDTKNFLALKDVLNKAVGSTQSVANSNETAMYEININVDHINNDYDVDKIAERIKKDMIKDAGYRNVTQVRHFR